MSGYVGVQSLRQAQLVTQGCTGSAADAPESKQLVRGVMMAGALWMLCCS